MHNGVDAIHTAITAIVIELRAGKIDAGRFVCVAVVVSDPVEKMTRNGRAVAINATIPAIVIELGAVQVYAEGPVVAEAVADPPQKSTVKRVVQTIKAVLHGCSCRCGCVDFGGSCC